MLSSAFWRSIKAIWVFSPREFLFSITCFRQRIRTVLLNRWPHSQLCLLYFGFIFFQRSWLHLFLYNLSTFSCFPSYVNILLMYTSFHLSGISSLRRKCLNMYVNKSKKSFGSYFMTPIGTDFDVNVFMYNILYKLSYFCAPHLSCALIYFLLGLCFVRCFVNFFVHLII